MAFGGVAPTPLGNSVVLVDEQARRGLLLHTETNGVLSMALRVEHTRDRALAHSPLGDVVRKLGAGVVSVRIDESEEDGVHASLTLSKAGELVDIDAAPNEALALAFGRAVPVFVSESLLSHAGVALDRFDFRKVREELPGSARVDEVEL